MTQLGIFIRKSAITQRIEFLRDQMLSLEFSDRRTRKGYLLAMEVRRLEKIRDNMCQLTNNS